MLCVIRFTRAACLRKHLVHVFFYSDGVLNVHNYKWQQLKQQYNISLHICSTSMKLRNFNEKNISKIFNLSGIGALVQATFNNKVITFG